MFSGSVFRLTVALFVACVCTVYGQNKLSVPPNKGNIYYNNIVINNAIVAFG